MVKRIEDLIKKWNYAELDNLLESDFPSELINLNTQKEIDELNPFDGTTMLSAQARFQCLMFSYRVFKRDESGRYEKLKTCLCRKHGSSVKRIQLIDFFLGVQVNQLGRKI